LISFVARNLLRATRIWIVGKEILTYEEELIAEFDKVWKSLGGAQSYRFCC
ncbi:1469_t:CDS:2, partial [Funneliformis geosporum]